MASERQMPSVGKVISGTHGYFWWNNSICYEITSFEAKIKTNRETINFSGQMWDDSKLMGVSGTWSAKIKKVYSRGKVYAEKLANGIDERLADTGSADGAQHKLLAVTSCPTGIAHTYMAAEGIEKLLLQK